VWAAFFIGATATEDYLPGAMRGAVYGCRLKPEKHEWSLFDKLNSGRKARIREIMNQLARSQQLCFCQPLAGSLPLQLINHS
jgi:hypothetical protein